MQNFAKLIIYSELTWNFGNKWPKLVRIAKMKWWKIFKIT